jgi:PAS domain S-box-containing protein
MVTGYAELGAVVRAVNHGHIFAYVTKPWNSEELQATVRKSVEHFELVRRLAHERQLLEDLLSNIPDGVYFKDREHRFERINPALAARLGVRDPDLAIGKRLTDLGVAPEVATDLEREETQVLASARALTNLLSIADLPNGRRWFSTTLAPVRDASGAVQGLVGISRDVTEREEAERGLSCSRTEGPRSRSS